MTIDIEQFLPVFFEESLERLETMETGLLLLAEDAGEEEVIHTIFRAAHSIKGGSATFGFHALTSLTHVLENLLDDMRRGKRQVTPEVVSVLLPAADCLRSMMVALRDGGKVDQARVTAIRTHLEALWHANPADGHAPQDAVVAMDQEDAVPARSPGWQMSFRPYPYMLRSGNNPVRIFRELETLGSLTVRVDTTHLPAFAALEPETCYLAWELTLHGDISRQQISEVFAWVEGDCELSLSPLPSPQPAVQESAGEEPRGTVVLAEVVSPDQQPSDRRQTAGDRRPSVGPRSGGDQRSTALDVDTSSIRVGIDKIDALINTVGELVITQSMLSQLSEGFDMRSLDKLRDGLDQLERNTRELQESVMRIRMLPMSFAFNRFPRLVHDLSQQLGKKAQLKISGEQTELDKTVLEKIGDPLLHLVRNALDHGIEPPAVRLAAHKPEAGLLHLSAYHQGGTIVIEVSDDGAGLPREKILHKAIECGLIGSAEALSDEQVYDLIFQPGFSTAEVVSEVSGRGVGMDVVRRNITALGGTIDVYSEAGRGTTFTIHLPLTLAILDGQLVRVGQETYIVPLVSIVESLQIDPALVHSIAGQTSLYKLRAEYIPMVSLAHLFHLPQASPAPTDSLLIVVEGEGRKFGLVVDALLGQQQVVIKSLETNFKRVEGVSGATILGDGTVALILDAAGLLHLSQRRAEAERHAA